MDDLGDPLLQIGTTFRLFIARQREPIVNRKKVALEKGTSQRVCDRPFRMLSQKLIEQLQGFIVGGAVQQISGLPPQVGVEFIASILLPVAGVPHIEETK